MLHLTQLHCHISTFIELFRLQNLMLPLSEVTPLRCSELRLETLYSFILLADSLQASQKLMVFLKLKLLLLVNQLPFVQEKLVCLGKAQPLYNQGRICRHSDCRHQNLVQALVLCTSESTHTQSKGQIYLSGSLQDQNQPASIKTRSLHPQPKSSLVLYLDAYIPVYARKKQLEMLESLFL